MVDYDLSVGPNLSRLLEREGGYVDHPADRGGATNMGITQGTLSDYRGYPVTKDDVRDLSRAEAAEIYRKKYWYEPGFHTLGHSHVFQEMLFDAAVHHGPARAIKLLQSALMLKADGIIGPQTRGAVNSMTDLHLCCAFMAARVSFIGSIITKNHSQAVFAAGWANRMAGLIKMIPVAASAHLS